MARKVVRHKPDYTPEGAAARRMARDMARNLGIPPRRLKRRFIAGYSPAGLYFKFTREFGERYLASKPLTLPSFFDGTLGEPYGSSAVNETETATRRPLPSFRRGEPLP